MLSLVSLLLFLTPSVIPSSCMPPWTIVSNLPPSLICLCPFICPGLFLFNLLFFRCIADSALEEICSKGDVKGQPQAGEYYKGCRKRLCLWRFGLFGLIVGADGHTVIHALSAALRFTGIDVFHPLSRFCTKSR